MILQIQTIRPFFDVPTLDIIDLGMSAINGGNIEDATLALMELNRRTRTQAAVEDFKPGFPRWRCAFPTVAVKYDIKINAVLTIRGPGYGDGGG